MKIVLCGNKVDLGDDERQVDQDRGSASALEFKTPFFETSALTGQNIDEAFEECAIRVVKEKLIPDAESRKRDKGTLNPRDGSFMINAKKDKED